MQPTSISRYSTVIFSPDNWKPFLQPVRIAIAAAETAVAIAIIINVYRNLKQVLTDDITDLKG